uniref:Large S protein n=1 Tax=Hepatitis B virus TaxID=10407 RepID=D2X401_HBV|nr:large S protein [Hepatitis B virus]
MTSWSSLGWQGMGTNLLVPIPLGFLPDHPLDPAFGALLPSLLGTSHPSSITGLKQIKFQRDSSGSGTAGPIFFCWGVPFRNRKPCSDYCLTLLLPLL